MNLFQQDKNVNSLLLKDQELSNIAEEKKSRLSGSIAECKDAACFIATLKFSQDEIKAVSQALTRLYKPQNALGTLVNNHLIPSGTYFQYGSLPPAALLVKAWEQEAQSVNYTIGVYLEGNKPNYPMVDSISFNTKSRGYSLALSTFSTVIMGEITNTTLFFEPSMQAALLSLEINERINAGDYEPMPSLINKAAFEHVKQVKWENFPYSVILVPGAGPNNLTTPLSAPGMLRCRLAAQAFRDGTAPFIIVSGGRVHPYKTPWNEAAEMKTYLVKTLGIPENVVITEPHARHTTTNLRNAARLIFRSGIPFDKTGLIITDKSQTDFIVTMDERCRKELGYVPYKPGKRLSATRLEFQPLIEAMQIDADEPMDP